MPQIAPEGEFDNQRRAALRGWENAATVGIVQESSRFARRSLGLAMLIGAVSMFVLLLSWFSFMQEEQLARAQLLRAQAAAAEILLSDEIMTMSANMAAATGAVRWISRYEAQLPIMDAAIAVVLELAGRENVARFDAEIRAANDRLVALEQKAFVAIEAGRLDHARIILGSDAYDLNKIVLAKGAQAFARRMIGDAVGRIDALLYRHNKLMIVIGIIAGIVTLLAWIKLDRSLRESASVSERAEKEIRQMADCDALTGLDNRRAFCVALENAVAAHDPTGKMFWVFMIDLDKFKPVNDFYGHQAGDAVLKAVSSRLAALAGENCRIARYGGDEFAAIVPDGEDPHQLAQQMLEALHRPISWKDHVIQIGASLGMVAFPEHAETADLLIDHADIALYKVKKSGRGSARVFAREEIIGGSDLIVAHDDGLIEDFALEDDSGMRPHYG